MIVGYFLSTWKSSRAAAIFIFKIVTISSGHNFKFLPEFKQFEVLFLGQGSQF
jgi:hypothetical protein